jgi:acyl transferase domain-containing protein
VIVVSGISGALVGPLPWPIATLPGFRQLPAVDGEWLSGLVEAALADAGRAADDLAWRGVGVFRAGDSISACGLAQRWDWVGPVLGVDAECAGGLVAFLLAADALALGQCDLAVVVADHIVADRPAAGGAAWDEGCAPLAAAAQEGAPRAGAAVLVLERAGEARRQRAQFAGGAHRRLGAAAGMVGLSASGIADLVHHALQPSCLGPADLRYWELHAVGTPIGDAVELSALCRVWAKGGSNDRPTRLGSHKAGFGHLEAAAGLVSLARLLAWIESGVIPPTAWREPFSPLMNLPPSLTVSSGGSVAMGASGCFALSRSGLGAVVLLAPVN